MNLTVTDEYSFLNNSFTFNTQHLLLLILLLNLPCLFLNLTILFKLLVKPHLWSFINANLSLVMSK